MKTSISLLFSCLLIICLCCCAKLSIAQLHFQAIAPEETNPGIKTIHSDHLALYNTASPGNHRLLIMIVGTGGFARDNYGFDSVAANMGYHVIGLDYNNTVITTTCSNSNDSTCFNTFRQEIVFGTDLSPLVSVDSLNSIYFRIKALLAYLSRKQSDQGWSDFIKGDSIQWSKIVVAGHSQGAGHAAYLGKKFPIARVLIFAGPQDYLSHFNTPASWLSQMSITPAGNYYAFLHLKDPFDFKKQLADCMKLMQSNNPDSVLVQPNTPLSGKHKFHLLITDINTANPHGSMLQPNFSPAWKYLLQFPSDKIKE